MAKFIELTSDIFFRMKETDWYVEYVAVSDGDYIKPGGHLGTLANARGAGASLTAQYGGEIVKVLIKEGDRFPEGTPIALLKINPWEFARGDVFANHFAGVVFGTNERRVFVVHGHGPSEKDAVSTFLSRLKMNPIVLHEQPGKGRTLIEKFEQHADVGFAVVVLTPDDLGADQANATGGNFRPRARQNVILELGYFIARLGRDRVCALQKGILELPSDILGIAYIELDERALWQQELVRELRAAGYAIDV
jgi:hypothetical protein